MNDGKPNRPPAVDLAGVERRAALGLAAIYASRMFGLFLVLPVFTLYAQDYPDYTPLLAGLAIGAYGLSQALLQIPFGVLSDRLGRKPVITAGLLLFAAGSVWSALATSVVGILIGRAIQGAGAIAGPILALAADLTREEHRTRVMAVIGASIGLSFAAALVVGPVLGRHVGLAGIFWVTAALALTGLAVLHLLVPTPRVSRVHRDAEPVPAQLGEVLRNPDLLRLDVGILALHFVMTALFVALPLLLRDQVGIDSDHHWVVYLGVLALSVGLMVPFVVLAERRRRMKAVFVAAVAAAALAQVGLMLPDAGTVRVVALLVLYFTAFNVLEATLPSLIARVAPPQSKGSAMGVYATAQFLGAFLGGATGGWALGQGGPQAVFGVSALALALWLGVAATMRAPRHLSTRLLAVGPLGAAEADALAARLAAVPGVAEAVVVAEDGVAYLKVDRATLDEEALARLSTPGA
jgi:predicted MFS family arabinose efflux permease